MSQICGLPVSLYGIYAGVAEVGDLVKSNWSSGVARKRSSDDEEHSTMKLFTSRVSTAWRNGMNRTEQVGLVGWNGMSREK